MRQESHTLRRATVAAEPEGLERGDALLQRRQERRAVLVSGDLACREEEAHGVTAPRRTTSPTRRRASRRRWPSTSSRRNAAVLESRRATGGRRRPTRSSPRRTRWRKWSAKGGSVTVSALPPRPRRRRRAGRSSRPRRSGRSSQPRRTEIRDRPVPVPVAWTRRPGATTAWVAVVVRKAPRLRTGSEPTEPPRARPVANAAPTRTK